MLNALVDREDGQIASAGETAMLEHALEIGDNARIAIRVQPDAIDEIGTREMQHLLGNFGTAESEQRVGFGAE
jgi:hypothetical protein